MQKGNFSIWTVMRTTICLVLAFWILLFAPTGWLYDLRAEEGTEQGQRSNEDVQQPQQQEDIETFLENTPATVDGVGGRFLALRIF